MTPPSRPTSSNHPYLRLSNPRENLVGRLSTLVFLLSHHPYKQSISVRNFPGTSQYHKKSGEKLKANLASVFLVGVNYLSHPRTSLNFSLPPRVGVLFVSESTRMGNLPPPRQQPPSFLLLFPSAASHK
jgi:hypothetical protein